MPGQGTFQFTVEKEIMTTAETVFLALTDAKELSVWFTTDAEVDLRKGGKYRNADGDTGEFLEIHKPERLTFSWDNPDHCPGTLIEIMIKTNREGTSGGGNGTGEDEHVIRPITIIITHSGLRSHEDVNQMQVGWKWALISLKSYLETGNPVRFEEWQKEQRQILEASQ